MGKHLQRITVAADGLIALGFGFYSFLFPMETFGTMIRIPEKGSDAMTGILASLSLFYILVGCMCLIGLVAQKSTANLIVLLMIIRHFAEGVLKVLDSGKDWSIGNPYPDIIIHSLFVLIYTVSLFLVYKQNRLTKNDN